MDNLLAGTLVLPWEGPLCRVHVQRRRPVEIIPGHRENHSGIERKLFAFPPEQLFAITPESRSSSPRIRFRVHPGTLFAFARNPQEG